jgi:hypothetical protein
MTNKITRVMIKFKYYKVISNFTKDILSVLNNSINLINNNFLWALTKKIKLEYGIFLIFVKIINNEWNI